MDAGGRLAGFVDHVVNMLGLVNEDHIPNEKAVRTCAFVGRLLGQPVNFVAELVNENDEEALRSAYLRATSSLKGSPNDLADRVGFEQESVMSVLRLDDVHFIVTRQ